MDTGHKFLPNHRIHNITPRVNCSINYGLWVKMCQGRFINCNKCITLVGDVDNAGGCACALAEGMWQISVPSS